jgi:hypothetical protein
MMNPWLLVILFIFHDGEEVLFLSKWVEKNSATFDEIERRFPKLKKVLALLRNNSQKQFSISVLLLLLILVIICGSAALFQQAAWIQNVFLSSLVIFTAHLFVHVGQSFLMRKVVPGAITSVLVFVPAMFLWFHQLVVMNLSFTTSLLFGLVGVILFAPLFPLILKFGHLVGKMG